MITFEQVLESGLLVIEMVFTVEKDQLVMYENIILRILIVIKINMIRKYNPYLLISNLATLSACNTSPVQSIVGSYFPAWMLALFETISKVIIYLIFVKINIDEYIPAKLLIYLGLALSLTFISWLILFGN